MQELLSSTQHNRGRVRNFRGYSLTPPVTWATGGQPAVGYSLAPPCDLGWQGPLPPHPWGYRG